MRPWALVPALALTVFGCGPAEHCEGVAWSAATTPTDTASGVLTGGGEAIAIPYVVTVGGLPIVDGKRQLDGSRNLVERSVMLDTSVAYAYAEGRPGADGKTQMPRVVVAVTDGDRPVIPADDTPYFPYGIPEQQSFALFDCSSAPQSACCSRDVTGCTLSKTLFVIRGTGEPFPPIDVSIGATARASVGNCASEAPSVELTRVTP